MVLNTTLHLYLAKSFIKGKAKNQINYLKYLNKYHKILDSNIKKMELTYKNIQKASTTNEVMGYEGSISVMYWDTKSKQLISKNIKEKLGSYTMWKKESVKVENIIQTQCYKLSKAIDEQSETYKPFIGKF